MKPKFKTIPEYGDKMTIKQFAHEVDSGGLIDYDGFGYLARNDKMSDLIITPSKLNTKKSPKWIFPKWATHVIWFNR